MTVQQTEETALQLVIALHRLTRNLRRAGTAVLPPTQLLVLGQLIDAESLRIGELAERVCSSQPTATTTVAAMSASGLVERVPDTADGRAVRVRMTELGRATLIAIAREQAGLLGQWMTTLTADERETLTSAVALLRKLSEPAP